MARTAIRIQAAAAAARREGSALIAAAVTVVAASSSCAGSGPEAGQEPLSFVLEYTGTGPSERVTRPAFIARASTPFTPAFDIPNLSRNSALVAGPSSNAITTRAMPLGNPAYGAAGSDSKSSRPGAEIR